MKKILLFSLMVITLYFLISPSTVYAELSNKNILDSVLIKYHSAANSWADIIQERAEWLFGSLALISFSWQFSQIVGSRGSSPLTEMIGELLKFLIFCGFYLWLLKNGPTFANAIIDSMIKIGTMASNQPTTSPSSLVDIGFKIYDAAQENLDIWSATSIAAYIISLIILVIFALIGINMLLQLCSAWVLPMRASSFWALEAASGRATWPSTTSKQSLGSAPPHDHDPSDRNRDKHCN